MVTCTKIMKPKQLTRYFMKYVFIKIGTMPLDKVLHLKGRLKPGNWIEVLPINYPSGKAKWWNERIRLLVTDVNPDFIKASR